MEGFLTPRFPAPMVGLSFLYLHAADVAKLSGTLVCGVRRRGAATWMPGDYGLVDE